MPDIVTSTELCPRCQFGGVHNSFLKNQEGRWEAFCDSGHKFPDTEGLRAEVKAAQQAYPETAPQKAVAAPAPPVPATLTMGVDDKQELERVLGVAFTGIGDLKGAIYSLQEDLKQARVEASNAKLSAEKVTSQQTGGLGPGQVIITIPEWAVSAVQDQAQFTGTLATIWVQEQFENFLEVNLSAVKPAAPVGA
jgi:hypothetical protein